MTQTISTMNHRNHNMWAAPLGACPPGKFYTLWDCFCKSWMTCCNLCHTPTAITCTLLLLGYKSSGRTGPWTWVHHCSAGLDGCTIFSAKTVYARSTWPCRFLSVGINWCIAFSANTIYTRGTFYKPSKDVCLIVQPARAWGIHVT